MRRRNGKVSQSSIVALLMFAFSVAAGKENLENLSLVHRIETPAKQLSPQSLIKAHRVVKRSKRQAAYSSSIDISINKDAAAICTIYTLSVPSAHVSCPKRATQNRVRALYIHCLSQALLYIRCLSQALPQASNTKLSSRAEVRNIFAHPCSIVRWCNEK